MNTNYWLNKMIGTIYPTSGKTYYIGLSSTMPTATGGGVTEPSGNGYTRAAISQFTQPGNGTVKNAASVTFATSTGLWFTANAPAKYWVLFDGSGASANVLASGQLKAAMPVWGSTTLTIAAGEISMTIADGG